MRNHSDRIRDALIHAGCGGHFHGGTTSMGGQIEVLRCTRCGESVEADFGEEGRKDVDAFLDGLAADKERWDASRPKPECGSGAHVEASPWNDGRCACGAMRFVETPCPTCGEDWYRAEAAP